MPNTDKLHSLANYSKTLEEFFSVLLMADDCATIASLIETVKSGVASLLVMPYYALFCRASEEYYGFRFSDGELEKEIYDIRNAIKVYSERFSKSQKRFRIADTAQDLLYRSMLRFNFLKKWNIHYNIGIFFDSEGHIIGDTQQIVDSLHFENLREQQQGEKSHIIGKHISKTIGALYTAYQRNGILPAKSLSGEIPNILYFDWNTNRKKSIFPNAYSKDVNLFILHMLGTLGFVNYYLARILPEDNCWLFRVRYITTYYVLLGVEKLANFLRTEVGEDDLLVRSSEALIKQRSTLFVSPFRNCMMHYDLIPNEESIIKQEHLDKDKKFFGLVESCYNGLGFLDLNLRLQSFTQDLIELLEGQVVINKEELKQS